MKKRKVDYKAKLDKVFSEYIRLKNANDIGFCRCVTCGKYFHWTKIQNGHYMSRRFMSTRYSEMNCHPQCVQCNVLQHGNIPQYRMYLVREYGEAKVKQLEAAALLETRKFSDYEFKELIDYYGKIVRVLKKEKG